MDDALQTLRAQILDATATRTPLDIRGHGSKAAWRPDPARADARTLDVTPLTGISAYEPTELVVTVRAGTPLATLEAALAEQGQFLAFEPPRLGGRGTVGGMVAAGLAGPARASVGSVRDFVLGATMLNGKGELLSFGGQVMKNVAGYDVSRLLAGSWGTLGVLCDVSLKVLPRPIAVATLRFALSAPEALAKLTTWSRQPLPLNASVWHEGVLLLRLSGAQAAVDAAQRSLGGETVAEAQAQPLWDGLRDRTHALWAFAAQGLPAGQRLWRLSVAPHAPMLRLRGQWLIEWHGGQRWLLSDEPAGAVHTTAAQAGGHAECHVGAAPGEPRTAPLSPVLARLNRQVRAAFDPHGLFDPQGHGHPHAH
ncbi:glycolate oxidase subunit GlcE [uncultured Sphaerotilus sp.]|uniref:glycolate oxidase subunit GlcE n=1 Tax=uncultured Sphaerotilus sp. TaxID=474984 RepID=UPI0030CA4596